VKNAIQKTELHVLVTHFHSDHTAGGVGKLLNRFGQVFKGAKLHFGPRVTKTTSSSYKAVMEAFPIGKNEAREMQPTGVTSYETELTPQIKLRVDVLCPSLESAQGKDENYASLGAHFQLLRGDQCLFSFLTLGDMDPKNKELCNLVSGVTGPVDVLKFPHHGSDSNYFEQFKSLISKKTVVLLSGFAGGEWKTLKKLVNRDRGEYPVPSAVLFSLAPNGKEYMDTVKSSFQTYVQAAAKSNCKLMLVKDVEVVVPFTATSVEEGKAELKAEPWIDRQRLKLTRTDSGWKEEGVVQSKKRSAEQEEDDDVESDSGSDDEDVTDDARGSQKDPTDEVDSENGRGAFSKRRRKTMPSALNKIA
jgi:hypothetical protein